MIAGIGLVNGSAVTVNVHYTSLLDYIILTLDIFSFVAVVARMFAFDPVKNATVYRIGLALMAMSLAAQSTSIVFRQFLGHPFNSDFQSSWALKDIAIFVLTYCLVYREWRANQILPGNEGGSTFKRKKTDGNPVE